ncbi:phage holin family protein [Methylobacter sp. BlB1]|uniref:phage holin family protein n=1 Tax=Methylobacter sp. BlB1 TaxID=2785914 RepID=UPI0018932D71|nr:phage holin family protein [Methylobacter sp. BlB1]MBF6649289.1 phage holin family protein [Methylobacter sp. BlB1]
MAIRPTEERPVHSSVTSGKPTSHADLLEDVRLLWQDLRELAHNHLKLATLEAKRAGRSLVSIAAAGVFMAVLLLMVWIGLMAAAVLALIESNMVGEMEAVLLITGVNLLIALMLFWFIRSKSRYLFFPETVNSLKNREDS